MATPTISPPSPPRSIATTVFGAAILVAMMLLFTGWFGYELGRRSMRPPSRAVLPLSPLNTSQVRSLADAVEEFNHYAQFDPIGKTQPPLTEDEVVAAIRGWRWTRKEHPVSEPVFQTFQKIAETKELPAGARLTSCSGWDTGPQGYKFEVWWIDLMVETSPRSGYNFRLRDQKLSSKPNSAH